MNKRQIVSLLVLIAILIAVFAMCVRPKAPDLGDEQPLAQTNVTTPSPVIKDEPVAAVVEAPIAEPEMALAPVIEELPATCAFPGDGFTPTIRGADPTDFIPFDYPRAKGNPEIPVQPLLSDAEMQSACVMLTYDISDTGQVINIQFYDVQPEAAAEEEYYKKTATVALRELSFYPGARNGKAVQVNNNVAEVRFE